MERSIRRQFERATRVVGFCRDNASALEGFEDAITRLQATTARATATAQEELTARLAFKEALAERRALATVIHGDLRLLARLARTAGEQSVGTPIVIRFPGPRRNQLQFLNGGRVAVETARERADLLARYDLPPGHLETITARLDEFAEWIARRDAAQRGHIAARQALHTVARELGLVLDQLHALVIHRFATDRARLGAWTSASGMRLRRRKPAELAAGGTGATQQALPPGSTPDVPAAA